MANRPAPALVLREGDREELERLTRSSTVRAGLAQRARIVLLAADGVANTRDRRAGRGVAADGDRLAGPVPAQRAGRAGRRAALGAAAHDRSRGDRGRDAEAAAEEARGDALVDPAAGPAPGDRRRHGGQGVAGVRGAAVAGGDVPVLHRPRAGRPRSPTWSGCTWRRRRTRSCCAWTRSPRSRRWTGPRRSCRCSPGWPSAAPTTTSGTAPRPCSPRWRSPPAQVTAALQAAAPAPGVPGLPQAGRPGLPRRHRRHGDRSSCTW